MNRELKFRAFYNSKTNPSMSYNVGVHPFMIFRLSQNDLCDEGEYNDNTGDLVVCPNAYAVMQFTGLTDSNGKEIYEGDILKFEGTLYTYEVRFENASFVCYHCKKDWGRWGNLSRIKDHDFSDSKINIIGNIYENPELLTP